MYPTNINRKKWVAVLLGQLPQRHMMSTIPLLASTGHMDTHQQRTLLGPSTQFYAAFFNLVTSVKYQALLQGNAVLKTRKNIEMHPKQDGSPLSKPAFSGLGLLPGLTLHQLPQILLLHRTDWELSESSHTHDLDAPFDCGCAKQTRFEMRSPFHRIYSATSGQVFAW